MKKYIRFIVVFFQLAIFFTSNVQAEGTLKEKVPFLLKSHIAIENMKSRIQALSWKINKSPDLMTRIALSESIYKYAFYTGNINDIQDALNQLTIAEKEAKGNNEISKRIHLLKATQQLSLHRFDDAAKELKTAKAQGATNQESGKIIADIQWNQGIYSDPTKYFKTQATKNPNMMNLMRLAILEHQFGNFEAANTLYIQSIKSFQGAEPITFAWLKLQYGVHKLEIHDYKSAKKIFKEALGITPNYVLILEHLAEVETNLNNIKEAISLYKKVLTLTPNPEFMGKLALLYKQQGKDKKAKALVAKATKKYQILLNNFPKAMYAHAAGFFNDHGQPQVALKLLQKNLRLRPTSESYLSLAEVQFSLNLLKEAKKNIKKAIALPLNSINLCNQSRAILGNTKEVNNKCALIGK